jgi:Rrf2 family transcriptional regulator, iron-sulfur cluster assembly transcription factor
MTVIFSKKCEIALQAVLFLSVQPADKMYNSGEIAAHLDVPKEFVSKILQTLTSSEIIGSKKGNNGGFFLSKPPEHVKLIDIVAAIDGLEIFHKCVLGFKGCGLSAPCPLHNQWDKLRSNTYEMLNKSTLLDMRDQSINKIHNLYKH